MIVFLANLSLKLQKICCYQQLYGNWNLKNIITVRSKLSTFQRGVNQVSIISSSWDFPNEIIFIGSHSTAFWTFFCEKTYHRYVFVEHASKHYCVTNEIMKRWYLFGIVLLLAGSVIFKIKNSMFLSIFCCFYMDFTGLTKKCWCSIF